MVAWADYGYNTAEGGPFGTTACRQAANLGAAILSPFDLRGEAALGASWADPIEAGERSQYGIEAYWRVLLMSNLWLTPGVQVLFDPTYNPETDNLAIAHIKFSVFL